MGCNKVPGKKGFSARPELRGAPSDGQEALWEVARLRVSAATLAAENDALRAHARQLAEQAAAAGADAAAARADAQAAGRAARAAAAARIADLEAEAGRQRGTLYL